MNWKRLGWWCLAPFRWLDTVEKLVGRILAYIVVVTVVIIFVAMVAVCLAGIAGGISVIVSIPGSGWVFCFLLGAWPTSGKREKWQELACIVLGNYLFWSYQQHYWLCLKTLGPISVAVVMFFAGWLVLFLCRPVFQLVKYWLQWRAVRV